MRDGGHPVLLNAHPPMTSYVSFALGTALIVGAGWLARRRYTPAASLRPAPGFTNDDIVWL